MSLNVTEQTKILSEFIYKTNFEDIPTEVIERAKLIIADTIAVIIKGSQEPEMQNLYKLLPEDDEAELIKENFNKTNISMASFANTTAACFVELDEGTSYAGHPALHILPPTLALSQLLGKSGADMITAFILGYEIQDRVLRAIKLKDLVYPHGNTGNLGAVVAIGKLVGWNAKQFQQGINCAAALPFATSYEPTKVGSTIATTFASFTGHITFMVKDLVESGFTGYDNAIEDTFGNILGKEFNPSALTDQLDTRYGIMENYFKFHASCGITHRALEAAADALEFKLQHQEYPPYKPGIMLNPNDIKNIKVIQSTKNTLRTNIIAQNKLSSKFSLPFSLAVFIVTGNTSTDSYSEKMLQNAQVRSLEKLVELEIDPFLNSEILAKIYIEMKDGQIISGESRNIYGRRENPANSQDIYNKFCILTDDVFSEKRKNELWNTIINLEKQENVIEIFHNR